jgi:hypothetical protein
MICSPTRQQILFWLSNRIKVYVEHAAGMGKRVNVYRVLVRKSEGKRVGKAYACFI